MKPVIYYRESLFDPDEKRIAERYFDCVPSLMEVGEGDIVIGRYSVLPFYKDQEADAVRRGARLINTHREHSWIADMGNWACAGGALADVTFPTWTTNDFAMQYWREGQFVVKGATNSKKFQWDTHMFAPSRKEVPEITVRLMQDGLVGDQDLYVREFWPLYTFKHGAQGLPITREFRFFCYKGIILSGGFYWSSHVEDLKNEGFESQMNPDGVPREFVQLAADLVSPHASFVAIDVAQTVDMDWVVVEINDGQMSGVSENNLDHLYGNLRAVLDAKLARRKQMVDLTRLTEEVGGYDKERDDEQG